MIDQLLHAFKELHGVRQLGMAIERSRIGKSLKLRRGARGWLFTLLFVVAPLPLLFHAPFVMRVIVPMLGR